LWCPIRDEDPAEIRYRNDPALIKLEAHGLIQRQPRKGAYVFRPTIEEFLAILEIHAGLEGQAAGLAARRLSAAKGRALEAAVAACAAHSDTKGDADPDGYYQLNLTFHATIVEAAGNPFLTDLVKSNARKLMAYYRARYQYRGTIAASAREHEQIARLILDRQSAQAEALMIKHVHFGHVTAMDLLTALGAASPGRLSQKTVAALPALRTLRTRALPISEEPQMTNPLYDRLFGQHADSEAVFLQLPDGDSLRYGDFIGVAAQYAGVLTQAGLEPGDRVAVQIEKSPQALAVYAACAQAGLVFLPLNTAYTAQEVAYFIENSGARVVLCDGSKERGLAPIAQACGARLETLNGDGTGSFTQLAARQPRQFATVARGEADLAAFLYTSGTTGRSKGAMLISREDVLLHALPIFHTHGLFVATNITLLTGGQMIFLPKFDLDSVIAQLPQATTMMGVPTFYTRLLGDARFTRDLAAHMRLFVSGSAPLLAETHVQFETRTGHRILERYGMTETNMNTSNPYDGERRAGTVGPPLPGVELKITDPKTGETLPQGEIGEIEVRGPNVFQGYWQMPEKTAEELRPDGFFITGDLGQIDADGYVSIVGRNKDLIISGGYNIYPKEVELLLDDQEGVLESAVIGVPHPDFGETVVGVLVAQPDVALDLDEISARVAASLARFKQPQKLVVVDALPRNTMGKVQKNALRETYGGLFS